MDAASTMNVLSAWKITIVHPIKHVTVEGANVRMVRTAAKTMMTADMMNTAGWMIMMDAASTMNVLSAWKITIVHPIKHVIVEGAKQLNATQNVTSVRIAWRENATAGKMDVVLMSIHACIQMCVIPKPKSVSQTQMMNTLIVATCQ